MLIAKSLLVQRSALPRNRFLLLSNIGKVLDQGFVDFIDLLDMSYDSDNLLYPGVPLQHCSRPVWARQPGVQVSWHRAGELSYISISLLLLYRLICCFHIYQSLLCFYILLVAVADAGVNPSSLQRDSGAPLLLFIYLDFYIDHLYLTSKITKKYSIVLCYSYLDIYICVMLGWYWYWYLYWSSIFVLC